VLIVNVGELFCVSSLWLRDDRVAFDR